MRKLFQNKVTIILLIIALVVLLAACNQNQGASEQAGEQIKDCLLYTSPSPRDS